MNTLKLAAYTIQIFSQIESQDSAESGQETKSKITYLNLNRPGCNFDQLVVKLSSHQSMTGANPLGQDICWKACYVTTGNINLFI